MTDCHHHRMTPRCYICDSGMIIAFDPGETTGVAYASNVTDVPIYEQLQCYDVYDFLASFDPPIVGQQHVIVYEGYRNGLIQLNNLIPVEVIGVIKYYAHSRHVPTVKQLAAAGKGYWTNERLRNLGIYSRGNPHAMDAVRHWLQYASQHTRKWIQNAEDRPS